MWLKTKRTAVEGEGLSVGADVFDGRNVDPVRLRNAHIVCMTLIDNCRGMRLEIVQITKHQMTLGETSNHTVEHREQQRYFAYHTR